MAFSSALGSITYGCTLNSYFYSSINNSPYRPDHTSHELKSPPEGQTIEVRITRWSQHWAHDCVGVKVA